MEATATTYNWDASGNLVRETTAGVSTYFYWVGGKLVGLKKNNTTYIVHDNLRGDVESITDTAGNIVAQAHYDSWGNRISSSGSLVQPMRYAGYYYDDETGLYYLQSRYYSPALGRFLTRDDHSYISWVAPQTLNLYAYCQNDPVNMVDPTGQLSYPGQIHNAVVSHIQQKYAAGGMISNKMVTYSGFGFGFADLVNGKTGEVWEVKRNTLSVPKAVAQLTKYTTGKLYDSNYSKLRLITGGTIQYDTFEMESGYETYYIGYWYAGNGIIQYDYKTKANWEELGKDLAAFTAYAASEAAKALLRFLPALI